MFQEDLEAFELSVENIRSENPVDGPDTSAEVRKENATKRWQFRRKLKNKAVELRPKEEVEDAVWKYSMLLLEIFLFARGVEYMKYALKYM